MGDLGSDLVGLCLPSLWKIRKCHLVKRVEILPVGAMTLVI